MASFSQFGNDLYTGKRSYDIVGRRKIWYLIALAMIVISLVTPWLRGGYQLGIEFTGGSEFTISDVKTLDQNLATETVEDVVPDVHPARLAARHARHPRADRAAHRPADDRGARTPWRRPTTSRRARSPRPSSVRRGVPTSLAQAIRGLVIFLVLAAVFMTLYFRTWKMSLSAMVGAAARPAHHGGRLRHRRVRGHARGGDRVPDDPRVLALRHRRGLRQGAREHPSAGDPSARSASRSTSR